MKFSGLKQLFVLAAIMLMLFPVAGFAAPFLVSDPLATFDADGVTRFEVSLDGAAYVASVPVAKAVKFDLAGITTGPHTVKARACNVWGCGADSVPFSFTKSIPGAPTTISIVSP